MYGIVKQHSGYIYVQSEPGNGTTFRTYFPTTEARETVQEQQNQHEGIQTGKETILLVDDDPSIRKLACNILRPLGYRIHDAAGALEALNISRSLRGTVHLLVTDVVMPDRNGRELAETLLAERPSIKVLFMSGYTDEIIARHGILESGAAFLHKPLTQVSLARKVRQVLDSENTGAAPAQLLPSGRKLRILIADDDKTIYELVKLFVGATSDDVTWAANGQMAVDLFRSYTYNLVIMDTVMPVMDGCTAINEIRAWEGQSGRKATPIILLSGNTLPEDIQTCAAVGATASVGKPFSWNALLKAIDACFEQKQEVTHSDTARDGNGRVLVKGDESLKELIPDYLRDRLSDVSSMQEALPRREFDKIRIIGHSMKGSGGSYGFHEISTMGLNIEQAAKNGDAGMIAMWIDRLYDYLLKVEVVYE